MQARVAALVGGVHGGTVTEQHLDQARVAVLARNNKRRVAKLVTSIHRAAGTQQVLCLSVLAMPTKGEELAEIGGGKLTPLRRRCARRLPPEEQAFVSEYVQKGTFAALYVPPTRTVSAARRAASSSARLAGAVAGCLPGAGAEGSVAPGA